MARDLVCNELLAIEAFKDIGESSLSKICKIANRVSLKKGEILFMEKDKINKFYAVLSGKVAMSRLSTSGQKRVFFILGEGSLVNEVVFDELPVSVVCECFENAIIMEFTKDEFLEIMSEDFKLTMNIFNSIGKKQRRLYRQLKNTLPIGFEKRLAAKLWKLSKDYGKNIDGWQMISVNVSITYLSYMLGTSRETISRAMKVLLDMEAVRWEGRKLYVKEALLLKYYRS